MKPFRLRSLGIGICGVLAFASSVCASTPAFPGALGFGANATGAATLDANGKHTGGNVYHVTNLNDSGTGSFRDAVSSSGRVVVFDVGGYINLASAVSVQKNITIAGQTAPGGGIGFTGAEISFANRSNIICRFIRIYPGGASDKGDDCLSFYRANNLIVDHTSLDFAKWNNIDAVGDSSGASTNITVQNSIIANPIGQQFGAHTEMVGGFFSWFNNVFANGHNRQPLAKDNTIFINNTLYNYEAGYTTHTSTPFKHDIINNYFICGPASGTGGNTWFQIDDNQSMYYSGNLKDSNKNSALDGTATAPYPGYQGTGTVLTAPWSAVTTAYLPSVLSTANAVAYDLSNAGSMPRDEIEALVLSQVKTLGNGTAGKGVGTAGPPAGLYTSQTQTGLSNNGFGAIANGTPPIDSDQDGMPDDWENAKGLKYKDATDGKLTAASGYTNLEDYLNWLALPHAFVGKNGALDIDLTQYTVGFPSTATYTVSGITGGTVTQSGQGNSQVHFVPTTSTTAVIGGFSFSVSSGGYTMTNPLGVLISANAASQNLVWMGNSATNPWDASTTDWINKATGNSTAYGAGDRVTFDDTGSHGPAVNIASVISPSSIEVNTNAQDYTFSGYGWLSGSTALVKDGAGTLTIAPTVVSLSASVTSGSPTVTVGSTANLTVGMPVGGTAIGGAVAIPSGTTLLTINSATSVTLSKNAGATGTSTLSFVPTNDYTGPTTFNAGTIVLNGGGTLGSGVMNLYGTLTNGASSATTVGLNNSIIVAPGSAGTVNMGNRFALGGSVTGGGTLNLNVQTTLTRDDLTGSFAAFAGTLNFIGGGGVRLFFNGGSFDGFTAASVNLGSNIGLWPQTYSGGNTLNIGELNGSGNLYGGTTTPVAPTPSVTWSIGGLNTSTTFAGSILDNGSFKSGLTKVGTGTLTLTGNVNFSGPMNLNAGTLATLGTFGGMFTINAATLSLGTPATPAGTLMANGGLTLTAGSTIAYGLSNSPTGANDKITATGGTLNLTSASTILVNFANGVLGAGTYALIDGTAAKGTTTLPTLVTNPILPPNSRQTLTLSCATSSDTTGYLSLTVVNDVAALTWTGGGSNTWSLSTLQNWSNAATTAADQFYNFDTVTFNDSVANGAVTLSGTVQPNTLNVTSGASGYTNYNFSGTGNVGGPTRLIKSGPGALTFSNTTANIYTGGTFLNGGQITLANATAGLGTGPIYMNGGTLQLPNAATFLGNSMVFTGTNTIFSAYSGNSTIVNSTLNTVTSVGNATLYLGTSGLISVTGDMSGFSGTILLGASSGTLRLNGGNVPSADVNIGSADTLFDLGTNTGTLSNRNGSPAIYLGGLQGGANTTLIGRQSGSGGYTNTATVTFTPTNGGSAAAATATAVNGVITAVTLTNGGSGYLAAPTVAFGGGNGSGATATATVSNGVVTGLTLTNGGTGARTVSNYVIGSLGTSTTFSGKISNNPGVTGGGDFLGLNIYKVGAGNWTLGGTSNFVGDILVQEGTLTVSGSLANSGDFEVGEGTTLALSGGTITTPVVTVDGSAVLTGNGTINGDVVSQGTMTIGSGTLTVNGAIENDGTMRVTGGALLMSSGGFVNNGLLDFITGNVLAVPPFVNNGTVLDSTSVKVTQLSKAGTTFNVSIQTYTGHTFALQRAGNLSAANWQTVQTMSGTGDVLTFSDADANGTQLFYRFQISP